MKKRKYSILLYFFCIFSFAICSKNTTKLTHNFNALEEKTLQKNELTAKHSFCDLINAHCTTHTKKQSKKKPLTIMIYMAADNDLSHFAARNINQMSLVGSNDNCNIVVHLDIKISNGKKITRRYFIEKNKIIHINEHDKHSQKMDSGEPETLYSFCNFAITEYPAKDYCLFIWNHGTGALDPIKGKVVNPSNFFIFDPLTNRFNIDRSIEFFDFIEPASRGICWDNSTGNYLSNPQFKTILHKIHYELMNEKKFAILGFDACLMAMIEIANISKDYASIMVGSQEVELGTGWNYTLILSPLQENKLHMKDFAHHIVRSYKETYSSITYDFCCSAFDLNYTNLLEEKLSQTASTLIECINKQKDNSVIHAIKTSKSKQLCTYFDEPSYIDLHHFLTNLLSNTHLFKLQNQSDAEQLRIQVNTLLKESIHIIDQAVFSNVKGKNLNKAHGISIYFPEKRIHPSYQFSPFGKENNWISLINRYLKP